MKAFFTNLLSPKAPTEEQQRREYILNVLLLASIGLSIFATSLILIYQVIMGYFTSGGVTIFVSLGILVFFLVLYAISRRGNSVIPSMILVSFYGLITLYQMLIWGFDLPQALLLFALVITLSGVLLGSRTAAVVVYLCVLSFLILSFLQVRGILEVHYDWRTEPALIGDAIVYASTFLVIYAVAWLYSREIDKSLERAQLSEKALLQERDLLELRVKERTEQLQKAQLERTLQLHRFADIGRHTSGLFHDLVNPLTTLSLHVELLHTKSLHAKGKELQDVTETVQKALAATERLEGFVNAARRQLTQQEVITNFSPVSEINQALEALAYRARMEHVAVDLIVKDAVHLHGDPIKFYKIVQNLLSNAIDAYTGVSGERLPVTVSLALVGKKFMLTVHDWGKGIPQDKLQQIFESFYTTKSIEQGTGIGLSIVQDLVESDFRGTIEVASSKEEGTVFTVTFPASVIVPGHAKKPTA